MIKNTDIPSRLVVIHVTMCWFYPSKTSVQEELGYLRGEFTLLRRQLENHFELVKAACLSVSTTFSVEKARHHNDVVRWLPVQETRQRPVPSSISTLLDELQEAVILDQHDAECNTLSNQHISWYVFKPVPRMNNIYIQATTMDTRFGHGDTSAGRSSQCKTMYSRCDENIGEFFDDFGVVVYFVEYKSLTVGKQNVTKHSVVFLLTHVCVFFDAFHRV